MGEEQGSRLTTVVRSLVLAADGQSGRVSITHWMTVGDDSPMADNEQDMG